MRWACLLRSLLLLQQPQSLLALQQQQQQRWACGEEQRPSCRETGSHATAGTTSAHSATHRQPSHQPHQHHHCRDKHHRRTTDGAFAVGNPAHCIPAERVASAWKQETWPRWSATSWPGPRRSVVGGKRSGQPGTCRGRDRAVHPCTGRYSQYCSKTGHPPATPAAAALL